MERASRGKVITIAKGGIGNQLFIYSAGRSLAENLGYDHFIESEIGFTNDSYKRSFLLNKFPIQSTILPSHQLPFKTLKHPRHKLIRSYNKFLPLQFRSYIAESHGINPHKFQNFKSKRKHIILNGNWCDEEFFIKHSYSLRRELTPPKDDDSKNIRILERIKKSSNSAFIHVRRIRYKSKLDMEYYFNAIQKLKSQVGECDFFLFSDDFGWVNEKFKGHIDFIPVQHNKNNELADLWLMSHCKHAITANSTFSWWGAWLGKTKMEYRFIISPVNKNWSLKTPDYWEKLSFKL